MLLSRGRNEICFCGSGSKYKKCCLKNSFVDDFVGMVLRDEPIPDEEYHDNREKVSEENMEILESFYCFLRKPKMFDTSQTTILFDELHAMLGQYPNHPIIVSHLYNGYTILGQKERAQFFLDELRNRFPRYVHGRAICARHALREKNVDQALMYLWNSHSLKTALPHRTVFHMSEIINFHIVLLDCYIQKEHEGFVQRHYHNVMRIASMAPQSGYNDYVEQARESIDAWSMLQVARILERFAQSREAYIANQERDAQL